MSRTLTPAPTDRTMWRKLIRVVHPDTGGEPDQFIWTKALYEYVWGLRGRATPRETPRATAAPRHRGPYRFCVRLQLYTYARALRSVYRASHT